MITFSVLMVALFILAVIAAIIIVVGGAGIILTLGDLIVCVLIIYALIRLFRRKKRR